MPRRSLHRSTELPRHQALRMLQHNLLRVRHLARTLSRSSSSTPVPMQCVIAENKKCAVVERPVPEPQGREVLVKVHHSALNRADTLQRKGAYPPPPGVTDILGLEMAGEVVRCGTAVEGAWQPGQRVMSLLAGGGYAQYCAADERLLMPVPDGVDLAVAGATPETWLTAFQLLTKVGEVQAGDTVLVHAAGSGVGIAATQLAIGLGARVVAVAGADSKLEHARSLGAFATVNYKAVPEFADAVLEATGGAGANLVLDPVGGGGHMAQNCRAIATEGRWVLYGLMGGVEPQGALLGTILRKRITIRGTTLRARSIEYKAALIAAFSQHALPKLADGSYAVEVDRAFDLADVNAAHELMESNATLGKIVLNMSHDE